MLSQTNVSKTVIDVGAGMNIPVAEGTFKDDYNLGYNIICGAVFILDDEWGIRPGLRYDYFSRKITAEISEGYAAIINLKIDAIYSDNISKKNIVPYGFAGIGIGNIKWARTFKLIREENSQFNFILNGGVGTKYNLSSEFSLFGEIGFNYNGKDIKEKTFINISTGLQLKL